jgi:hypothetical protein
MALHAGCDAQPQLSGTVVNLVHEAVIRVEVFAPVAAGPLVHCKAFNAIVLRSWQNGGHIIVEQRVGISVIRHVLPVLPEARLDKIDQLEEGLFWIVRETHHLFRGDVSHFDPSAFRIPPTATAGARNGEGILQGPAGQHARGDGNPRRPADRAGHCSRLPRKRS